jgi:6-phosphogluconolactonase (cycloisomerase 2 family)
MSRLIVLAGLLSFALACQKPAQTLAPGHYLYVIDGDQGEVSGYRLDESTGALSLMADSAFLKGHVTARSLTLSPDGKFGFLGTLTATVPIAVDAKGILTERQGVQLNGWGYGSAIHPSGKFLYYANDHGFDLKELDRDGIPSAKSGANHGVHPDEISIDPSGRLLAAYTEQSAQTHLFEIDASTGQPTAVPGSPVHAEDFRTRQSRMHPDGHLLFVLTEGTNGARPGSRMHVFLRAPDGITAVIGSPFPLRSDAQSFAFSPDGRYMYVVHKKARAIALYAIDDAGGIHPGSGSTFRTAAGPELVEVDPGGKYMYVTYPESKTTSVFSIDQDSGSLKSVPGATVKAGQHPWLSVFVLPPPMVDTATLPSPESASLRPIDTTPPPDPGTEDVRKDVPLLLPGAPAAALQ